MTTSTLPDVTPIDHLDFEPERCCEMRKDGHKKLCGAKAEWLIIGHCLTTYACDPCVKSWWDHYADKMVYCTECGATFLCRSVYRSVRL